MRLATGQSQAIGFAFAGNAVALVPAVALAAGESYEVRAGLAIRDLAGHPPGRRQIRRLHGGQLGAGRGAGDPSAAAARCSATPASTVAGQATAGALVKVKDGSLLFSGNADAGGHFSVRLPLAANGWHYLSVYLLDEAHRHPRSGGRPRLPGGLQRAGPCATHPSIAPPAGRFSSRRRWTPPA